MKIKSKLNQNKENSNNLKLNINLNDLKKVTYQQNKKDLNFKSQSNISNYQLKSDNNDSN